MATYVATVDTPYGAIQVQHDGTPTNAELKRMAMDKAQEREKLARIEAGMQKNEPSGFTPIDSTPVEEEEEPEDDLVADIAKGFMRVGRCYTRTVFR